MPYITQDRRNELHKQVAAQVGLRMESPGELNYMLTNLCLEYLNYIEEKTQKSVGYTQLNDIIGALEACKLEFYRRLVQVYEDQKIKENGDVY